MKRINISGRTNEPVPGERVEASAVSKPVATGVRESETGVADTELLMAGVANGKQLSDGESDHETWPK
jgi:hypothetical protein